MKFLLISLALMPSFLDRCRAAARAFSGCGYEAVEDSPRRPPVQINLRSEDDILQPFQRDRLISATRTVRRTAPLAGWMLRKHLDLISTFSFQCNEEDDSLCDAIQQIIEEWSRPENCDAAGRHSLRQLMRLQETHKVLDGDVLHVQNRDGTLSLISGPRIRTPQQARDGEWIHGVRCTRAGKALGYAVHRRSEAGGWELESIVDARDATLAGYYDSAEQVRGISPLATAINQLRDSHSNLDLALAKHKVACLFALAFTSEPTGTEGIDMPGTVTEQDAEDSESGQTLRTREVDFGQGPQVLNLDPGEDAKFLEASGTHQNFESFHAALMDLVLLTLDLPSTFLRPTDTNFVGQLGALQLYRISAANKQQHNVEVLRRHTEWVLSRAVLDGRLVLPAGRTVGDLQYDWIAQGLPWWDPSKEIRGALLAITAGLDSPQRVARELGRDFYANVDELASALEYSRGKLEPLGMALRFDAPQEVVAVEEVDSDA